MNCKHEAFISLDNLIHCKLCGLILDFSEEVISKTQSAVNARKIQDSVASGYKVLSYDGKFVVYARASGNLIEQIIVRKEGDRKYLVIKKNFIV